MPVSMLSTSLFSDRKSYSRFNALDTIYTPPSTSKPGMVLVSPTSITHSGTSATLGANGQVTFTAVTSLSLNGVFTADFDNYVVSMRFVNSSGNANIRVRFRASGSDASGTDYVFQTLNVDGSGVSGGAGRDTAQTEMRVAFSSNLQRAGSFVSLYGPALAQPTAMRSSGMRGTQDASLNDFSGTHSLSTSYDGITFLQPSGAETGALAVYGVRS